MCFIDLFNEEVFVTNILGEKDRDRETNRVEEFSLRYTESKYQNQMGWRTTNSKIFSACCISCFVFFNSYTSQRGVREHMGKDKDTKSCTTTMNSK